MNRSVFLPALAGGAIGAVIASAILLLIIPGMMGACIVRAGMMSDPAILSDTVEALRNAQYEPVLEANRAQIETPFGSSWKGAKDADVTVVEFFDYACPYCKTTNPIIDRLLGEDNKLRVVYRELPILGRDSVVAARMSLTASKQGRFAQFHDTLWAAGRPAPDTLAKATAAAGIDPVVQEDPAVEAELKKNFQLAGQLGATGTPLFVIGDRVVNTAMTYEQLKEAVAKARSR